jgi:hypothetical protein
MMPKHPDLFEQRKTRPTIDELRAKYGPTWGIKTTANVLRGEARERELRYARECADRAILAEYAALGLEPVLASDGTLVSPALLRSLDRLPHKRVDNALEGDDMR